MGLCEKDKMKAANLACVFPGVPIFKDMKELRNGHAQTWSTGTLVVPKVALSLHPAQRGPCLRFWRFQYFRRSFEA